MQGFYSGHKSGDFRVQLLSKVIGAVDYELELVCIPDGGTPRKIW